METSQAYAGDGEVGDISGFLLRGWRHLRHMQEMEVIPAYAGEVETSQAYAGDGVIPAKRWRHLRHMQEMG